LVVGHAGSLFAMLSANVISELSSTEEQDKQTEEVESSESHQ